MKLIKISRLQDRKVDADKLTYNDYLILYPKGDKKHFEALTGKTFEPQKKVLKEEDHGVINDLQEIAGDSIKEEKSSKVLNKGKSDK